MPCNLLHFFRLGLCLTSIVWLAACQPVKSPTAEVSESVQSWTIPGNAQIYALDGGQSNLDILVYRAGSLASLGHNHVVSSTGLSGNVYLTESIATSVFELSFPVAELRVDDHAARAKYGADFASAVDADSIAGTQTNMRSESQLDATHWPRIVIRSRYNRQLEGNSWLLGMTVTVRGNSFDVEVPAEIVRQDNALGVTGEFSIRQTDLGLQPFSVMLGALQVRDELDIRIQLSALHSQ
jgi:polyisoprenoid-binding protein YceI